MGATLELKYFNSYWLKKLSNVVDENPSAPSAPYENVPYSYANDNANDWYIEEARIRVVIQHYTDIVLKHILLKIILTTKIGLIQ